MCILEPLNVSNVVIVCNCGTGTYFAIRHVCVADVFLVIEVLSGHGRSALACSLSLACVYVMCVCVCVCPRGNRCGQMWCIFVCVARP